MDYADRAFSIAVYELIKEKQIFLCSLLQVEDLSWGAFTHTDWNYKKKKTNDLNSDFEVFL